MRNLKKFVAVIVAIALMASLMVPAFAAEGTLSADAQACKVLGMLEGGNDGLSDAYMASEMDRVQGALLFLRLQGVGKTAEAYEGTTNFADAKDYAPWGQKVMAYLKDNAKYGFVGDTATGNFLPKTKLTAQMYTKILLTAMGYVEGTDFQYATVITEAKALGLSKIADKNVLTPNDVAAATVEALKAKVKGGASTLAEKLVADKVFTAAQATEAGVLNAALELSSLTVVDSKTLAVKFNRELTADEKAATKFTFKKDAISMAVSAVAWDKETAKFTKADGSKLVAGTYEVTVTGFTAAKSVTYAGETIKSIAISTNRIKDAAAQKLVVTGKNQFDEDITVAKAALTVVAYDKTTATSLGSIADIDSIDISASTANNDVVQFTAYVTATPAVMVIKDVKVDNFFLGTITFGDVAVPTGATRITAGQTNVELPYTATDNAGEAFVIAASVNEGALESNTGAIVNLVNVTGISVNSTGKMLLDLSGSTAGTATVQIINTMTGTVYTKSFTVAAAAAVDQATLSVPADAVYAVGDDTLFSTVKSGVLNISALDQFGVALTNAQIDTQKASISITSSNQSVIANSSITINANGTVKFTPAGAGTTTLFTTVGAKVTTLVVEVKAARYPAEIVVKTAPATNLVQGGATTTILYELKDQYGKVFPDADIANYDVFLALTDVSGDAGGITVTGGVGSKNESAIVGDALIITSASAKLGVYKLSASVRDTAHANAIVSTVDTTFNVIADNATGMTIGIDAVPALHAVGANFSSEYAKVVTISGTDANGVKTVFPTASFIGITSSDPAIAAVELSTKKVVGVAKGTATLTAVVNTADGIKTAQITVTVTDEALVPQTIVAKGSAVSADATTASIAVATLEAGIDLDTSAVLNFEVADQFGGVAGLDPVAYLITNITGDVTASDIHVAANGTLTIDNGMASVGDTFKVTAVTSNGKVATITITVAA